MASGGDFFAVHGGDAGLVGKRGGHDEPPGAGEGMHGTRLERVVDLKDVGDEPRSKDVHEAGSEADDDRRPWLHTNTWASCMWIT